MEVWREERRGLGQLRLAVALARGHGGTRERRTASGSDCWASASAKSLAVGGEGSLLNETEHGGGAGRGGGQQGARGRTGRASVSTLGGSSLARNCFLTIRDRPGGGKGGKSCTAVGNRSERSVRILRRVEPDQAASQTRRSPSHTPTTSYSTPKTVSTAPIHGEAAVPNGPFRSAPPPEPTFFSPDRARRLSTSHHVPLNLSQPCLVKKLTNSVFCRLPHELCARLSNASLARHRFVPLQPTKQHLSLLSLLLSHGFISSLSYGSTSSSSSTPPDPSSFREARISDQRVWAELKYRAERPVLEKMSLVSHPSKRVFMDKDEIKRFVQGARVKFVPGLVLGEVALINSRFGWMEGREAVRRGVGGEVIARVG